MGSSETRGCLGSMAQSDFQDPECRLTRLQWFHHEHLPELVTLGRWKEEEEGTRGCGESES